MHESDSLAARFEEHRARLTTVFGVPFAEIAPIAAARDGDFNALLAVLDPDVVLRADEAAVQLGAAEETRGAAGVAAFCRRARDARAALLGGAAAVVWMPAGRPRVVYSFTIRNASIVAIDLIADPARLSSFELTVVDV